MRAFLNTFFFSVSPDAAGESESFAPFSQDVDSHQDRGREMERVRERGGSNDGRECSRPLSPSIPTASTETYSLKK